MPRVRPIGCRGALRFDRTPLRLVTQLDGPPVELLGAPFTNDPTGDHRGFQVGAGDLGAGSRLRPRRARAPPWPRLPLRLRALRPLGLAALPPDLGAGGAQPVAISGTGAHALLPHLTHLRSGPGSGGHVGTRGVSSTTTGLGHEHTGAQSANAPSTSLRNRGSMFSTTIAATWTASSSAAGDNAGRFPPPPRTLCPLPHTSASVPCARSRPAYRSKRPGTPSPPRTYRYRDGAATSRRPQPDRDPGTARARPAPRPGVLGASGPLLPYRCRCLWFRPEAQVSPAWQVGVGVVRDLLP
jgi:hypothetical protein